MSFEFPAAAPAFYYQSTPGKARLFTGEFGSRSRSVFPLTTVSVEDDRDVDRLINALESAAWHGNRDSWEALAATIPDAVVLACNQALAAMPPHTSLAIGSDGWPLTVVMSLHSLSPGGEDLHRHAKAAYDSSMQVLIDNYVDDFGDGIGCRLRLLSGDMEIRKGSRESAWPAAGESVAERRMFGPNELEEVLEDPRWLSNRARAHWFWVVEEDEADSDGDVLEAVWVVEYFDEEVPDDPEQDEPEESQQFVVGDWNPWPMTPRTRFVLWRSLVDVLAMLEDGLGSWPESAARPQDDDFMADFPVLVRSQPRNWWVAMRESCSRLVEATRTGRSWNPQTPAEEALIYIACRDGWVLSARNDIDETGSLRRQLNKIPEGMEWDTSEQMPDDDTDDGPDYDWDEVPAALAGDIDIEMLWMPELDGIENPDDQKNAEMGVGDYRPQSWHHRFDRYAGDAEHPSALY
ncbi:hypothetical protein [Mycobacterium intracellulare]|uniref:hypothetical protein n=1 Tax=Mycobacterium intracellulare TaxID=1767 RepID=UPI000AC7F132|nr:hypothetical protein [Mycobacterium intracellulare]